MFVCRTTSTEILVNMGGVMVDDNNHPAGLGRFFYLRTGRGFLQEFAQPRNFFLAQIMGARPLEKHALAADAEHKFIASMRLDLTTQVLDQIYSLAPTQIVGQLTVEKILVQRFEVLAHSVFSFTKKVP
jgi:hypothetical protein